MSIGLSSHPLLFLTCLLAAGAFTFWAYRHTTPRLPTPIKSLLAGLRFAAFGILIFLLFDPIVTQSTSRDHPPVLALLVDNSASQTLADSEMLRERLRGLPLDELPGDVRIFGFDARTRLLGTNASSLDSITFDGGRTNIGQAIEHLRRERNEDNIRSIVLVSDGLYNSGRNPIYSAEESVVPVHTVVTGDTSAFRDIRIQEVLTNELAYAGVELPVRVRILSDGYEGDRVTVALQSGSNVLSQQAITLRGDGTEQAVDLAVTPSSPGLMRYTATVTRLEGEATHRNNERSFQTQVVENRRRILIVSGAPDPDLGALRQSLSGDPSFEIRTLTQQNEQAFLEGSLPASLDDVDLVVLAGFPHARSSPDLVAQVEGLLEDNTPVLHLAGRRSQTDGLRSIGSDVLPALPSSQPSAVHEAQPALTAAGASHPVMSGHEHGTEAWSNLPPAAFPDAGWQAGADVSVLATVRSRGVDLGEPLIVIRNRAGRRSAAVLAYDLWMWRTLPPSLDQAHGLFDHFIANLIQWLTSPEDDRLVRVQPVQEVFEGGEAVRFTGEVYDERLQPVTDADIRVSIEAADGRLFPFTMTAEGRGRYRLDAGQMPEGSYLFTATATSGDIDLGSDQGAFSVGALEFEFQETRADGALMRQIAVRSGGLATNLDDLTRLVDEATSAPDFLPETEYITRESSLRHVWLLLALALFLLASEWILRKRSGMI